MRLKEKIEMIKDCVDKHCECYPHISMVQRGGIVTLSCKRCSCEITGHINKVAIEWNKKVRSMG